MKWGERFNYKVGKKKMEQDGLMTDEEKMKRMKRKRE